MGQPPANAGDSSRVRKLYERAVADYGNALKRLTRAYEADADRRRDVLQEIHLALWESLARFDSRCALGTWVYRVAHNTATSICIRRKSARVQLVSLEDIELPSTSVDRERDLDERQDMERLLGLIQRLRPLDRQVMLLYLEDIDARAIGEIVGLSAANVATKIHRVKKVLAQQFQERGCRMSKSDDDRLRSAWAKQTDQSLDVDLANAEASVRRRRTEIARRDRRVYVSVAIIGPSWLYATWFMPDLRLASVTGLFIAAWLTWQVYRRSGARLLSTPVDVPCLVFQRTLLERERDLAVSLPKWYLVPVVAGQVAIAATLATSPRFTTSHFYPGGLVLFVGSAGVALVVIWRRWQRQAMELQRELDAISVSGLASSFTESRS